MTKKRMFVAALTVSWLLIGCGNGNGPAQPPLQSKPLELLYPTGGESLKAGDTVTVQWRINDSTKISSVMAKLSTNNGVTYDVLFTTSGSVFPPQASVPWTITSGQLSNQCKINIYEYNDPSINDKSGTFTVHN
jgi:hypothetical protein